jgi:hypothetical protein
LPLVVHYGFLQGEGGGIDAALNQELVRGLAPTAEVVFAASNAPVFEYAGYTHPEGENYLVGSDWEGYAENAPHPPGFTEWRGHAKLAKRIRDEQLAQWLASATPEAVAERFARFFRYGWDYVYVDELSAAKWGDRTATGRANLQKLRQMLNALDTLGFDRRLIIFINPSTVQIHRRAQSPGPIAGLSGLMRTCARHCRALLFETYPENARGCRRCVKTSTVVSPRAAAEYVGALAARVERVARTDRRALMSVSGAVIGASNEIPASGSRSTRYLNVPGCDLSPLAGRCPRRARGRQGGIHAQIAVLNRQGPARRLRTLGFYSLARLDPTSAYTRRDYALAVRNWSLRWARLHR